MSKEAEEFLERLTIGIEIKYLELKNGFITKEEYHNEVKSYLIAYKNDCVNAISDEEIALIKAWEQLAEGDYKASEISKWLLNDMKPVIDKVRNKLLKKEL